MGEADSQPEWADVQKKIIPWGQSTLESDLELAFQDRAAKLGKSISRLIVVASLIDKPANLGGKVIYPLRRSVLHTQRQASEERLGWCEPCDMLEAVLVMGHSVQGCAGPVRCSGLRYLLLAVSSVSAIDSSSISVCLQSSGFLWWR